MHPYSFWRNFRNYNFISQGCPMPQLLWGAGGEDGSARSLGPSAVGPGRAGLAGAMLRGSAAPGVPAATSLVTRAAPGAVAVPAQGSILCLRAPPVPRPGWCPAVNQVLLHQQTPCSRNSRLKLWSALQPQ